ncbi:alpha/beta fold hydrolase [Undibacter mobilis]|uniref:Alpha/beta fold hydrolase n=1 Tax=Undibacter mobilis TaxID=2292256 RepID=A0A371BBT2_9BRAD|nr:alpha/beta fold hydrolase [Undibacter mobilis]
MTGGWCEVGGVALRYRCDGSDGPFLILIHEMGGMIESWDRVVPLLQDRFRIFRFDMRGAGMSEKVREGIRVDQLADDLAALLDTVGVTERAVVAGCAVGAAVALSFVTRHPERSAGLVLMNPALSVTPENLPALRARAEHLRQAGTHGIVEESLASGYPESFRAVDAAYFEMFRARWLANDPESLRAHFLMLAGMDLRGDVPKVACPILGISGRLDPLRPTSYVRELLDLATNARLVVIEAGHHMPDQAPDAVAQELAAFVTHVMGSRAGEAA